MPPKVSVFLPTYQQRHLVAESLECALGQDYPDFEVVVGDDGSTDGTQELLREYASRIPEDRLKLVLSPVNTGITGNCNRVLAACTGEYVAFFAGDDLWEPSKLRRQVEWLEAHPDAVLCYTQTEWFDGETGRGIRLHHAEDAPFWEGGQERFLRSPVTFVGASVMARRSAIPAEGFDARLRHVSDWLFWLDLLRAGTAGYLPEVLTRYRLHPNNITKRGATFFEDQILAYGIAEERYPEHAAAIRRLRGETLWQRGLALVRAGDDAGARECLRRAFAEGALESHPRMARGMQTAMALGALPVVRALLPAWDRLRGRGA